MVSRKRASIQNAGAALVTQMIMMLGQFLVQTIFIRTLGAKYLGANGLFGNLMTFLSFAELGIGAAFSYALYKPIAQKDHAAIRAIMKLFRKVYNLIGCVILALGLILTIFIPWFIRDSNSIPNIRFYFVLYLLSTVVSYFFTYNRTLVIADQKSYIDAINQMIFAFIRYALQLMCLFFFKSYFGYLAVLVLTNLLSNIVITYQVHKRYPYLKASQTPEKAVDPLVLSEMKRNVIGTISSKVGLIVVTGTDNILISKFIGLTVVGLYSNYALVLNSITTLLSQVFSSVIASFGNMGVTEKDNKQKQVSLFNQFTYYNAIIVFFIGLVAYAFFPTFISFWLGRQYQLPESTLIIIILNFVLAQFRPALYMINAYGLFWGYRFKSIVEATVNFGLSLMLVKFTSWGINGVLIGTIIGNVLVNSWWDPLILYRGAFGAGIAKFYARYYGYMLLFLALLTGEVFLMRYLNPVISGLGAIILFGLAIGVAVIVVILLCFAFAKEQKEMFRLIFGFIHKR